jgi:hypothetical protein
MTRLNEVIAKAKQKHQVYEDFRMAAYRLEKQQNEDDDKRFGFPSLSESEKRFAASAKTDADYLTLEASIIRYNARMTRQSANRHGEAPDATPVHEWYRWRCDVEVWRQHYARRQPRPA